MLGRNYRFSVNNQGGVNVDVTIQARRWKYASDGSLSFDSEVEVFNVSAIASSTTAWSTGTAQDNSTDKWIGADLEVAITPSASATGGVTVQVERSTDGGTTWPSAGLGEPAVGAYFSASSAAQVLSVSI